MLYPDNSVSTKIILIVLILEVYVPSSFRMQRLASHQLLWSVVRGSALSLSLHAAASSYMLCCAVVLDFCDMKNAQKA